MANRLSFCIIALAASLTLAACGGGGGGGENTSTGTGASTGTGTGTGASTGTGTGVSTSVSNNTPYAPTDPLFSDQWHLKNTGQSGVDGAAGTAGEDLNVEKVWTSFKGTGQRIAIIDDGLDLLHEDLAANVVSGASWDYTLDNGAGGWVAAGGNLVTGNASHGTMCGGLAASVGGNSKGGVGVAMAANLVGYNLLSASNGGNSAEAIIRGLAGNTVYSNSYGATDGTGTLQASDSAWQTAINKGITEGRGGKGAVYTWAAGNGGPVDRSDYDGEANFAGVIAVAALNDKGKKASYSEPGSNVLISAYGGEFCDTHTLTTTDITGAAGDNAGSTAITNSSAANYGDASYSKCMNGTSGATPEVSGAVALILEANPALTFRDVRIILAATARKNDAADAGWMTNGAGLHINDKFGFGAVDMEAAVNAALGWASVGGIGTLVGITGGNPIATPISIADGSGTSNSSPVYGASATSVINIANSNIGKIEFVDVTVDSDHLQTGDLKITLTSPAGTVSTLAVVHGCINADTGDSVYCGALLSGGFRFGVARLINEAADGAWTLSVTDGLVNDTGKLVSWKIDIYGR